MAGKFLQRAQPVAVECVAYEFLAGRVGWQEMGIFLQ